MANSQTYFHLLISMISTINKINRRKYLKMIKEILLTFLVGLTLSSEVLSLENITLTVYKGGYAVITDNRKIKYDAGISTVYITDLPSAVSPASIIITPDNSIAKIRILEKNFESNDQGKSATLKNYINKTISFETSSGSPRIRTGKLLAFDDNFIKIQNPSGQV
jgi:predicted small secreted protein